jgi:hypothetical protein
MCDILSGAGNSPDLTESLAEIARRQLLTSPNKPDDKKSL